MVAQMSAHVEARPDALDEVLDARLAEAVVSASRAGLRAVRACVDAPSEEIRV